MAENKNIKSRAPVKAEQAGNAHAVLRSARFASGALMLCRELTRDELISELCFLLECIDSEHPDLFRITGLYSSVGYKLLKAGLSLKAYFIDKILHTENPFSIAAEAMGAACLAAGSDDTGPAIIKGSAVSAELWGKTLEDTVKSDLANLQTLAGIRSEWIKDVILHLSGGDEAIWEAVMKLPPWIGDNPAWQQKASGPDGAVAPDRARKIRELMLKSDTWPDCAEELAEFHRRCGSGIFSKYRSFVWRRVPAFAPASVYNLSGINTEYQESIRCIDGSSITDTGTTGSFIGVESPDHVRFSDLISYELEREEVIQNTLHFLDGRPANNILLYGDRGTGKSSTIKALANEYHDRGLRIIEVPKGLLADFPLIIRRLAGRSLKFILFVDDLSFEDNDENFTALKAILEGGLEIKPDNVLIYATSNRKHLVKERFSERAGLASAGADDEVRAADTIQEKLSLSDRFGMTVVFSSPDKKTYLEIVEGIAKKRGLEIDREYLHSEAMKWELQYNGRSPRTARQFVDWLEANMNR